MEDMRIMVQHNLYINHHFNRTIGNIRPAATTQSTPAASTTRLLENIIDQVSIRKTSLDAVQKRLESTVANLESSASNNEMANSSYTDPSLAKQMISDSMTNILENSEDSMSAQSNQYSEDVLSLLM